jgi:hypothetical protein
MNTYPCPCCGHANKLKAKPVITGDLTQAERDALSETDLRAYYAQTSHIEDVAFFLRNARTDVLTDTLREQWLLLYGRAPRMQKRAVQAEYRLLLTRYWLRVEERERAEHPVPAPRYLGGLYKTEGEGDIWTFGYFDTTTGAVLTPDEWTRAGRMAECGLATDDDGDLGAGCDPEPLQAAHA